MDSVTSAILFWVLALAILAGFFLIYRATKMPKDQAETSEDIRLAPHRLERLRQVHEQVQVKPRHYGD